MSLTYLEALAIKYTPYIYFTKDEKYMPASFEHMLKNFRLLDEKREVVKNVSELVKKDGKCIWTNGPMTKPYFLDFGLRTGDDGYKGTPDPKNPLYGDPHLPKQYINAYTLGVVRNEELKTSFVDIVYAVYFCWNGTSEYHAFDAEEVTLRFEKRDANYTTSYGGYNEFDTSIINKCNKAECGEWFLVRVFLSTHGNGMWYPTQFPGDKKSVIEFYKDTCHPVIYSARGGHPMYPNAGIQKRMFGFGSDVTEAGQLWKPTHIGFWSSAFKLLPQSANCTSDTPADIRIGDLSELDISKNKKIANPNPYLWFSYFNGWAGNIVNGVVKEKQTMVPFKTGVLNLISAGDSYYKFQKGGVQSTLNQGLSKKSQRIIAIISCIICAMLFVLIFLKPFLPVLNIINPFMPLLVVVSMTLICVSMLIILTGESFPNKLFLSILTNKKTATISGITLILLLIVIAVCPFVITKKIF